MEQIKKKKAPKVEKMTRKNVRKFIDERLDLKMYDEALDLIRRFRVKEYTVTRTTAKKDHKLPEKVIDKLHSFEVKNPHYSCAAPMKLYLKAEIEQFSLQ